MVDSLDPPGAGLFGPLGWKLESERELQALWVLVKEKELIRRGKNIVGVTGAPRHLTVLLAGVACWSSSLRGGRREIHAFQYPGDLCDLHRYLLPEPDDTVAVRAITDCSIGFINYEDVEQAIERYPRLGLALWRASMLQASILRERQRNISREPALLRVANLLCEQLARIEAAGIGGTIVPLTQFDLADAVCLPGAHIDRILQSLRDLGVLSTNARTMEVVDRDRLTDIASFDGSYLNMQELLSHWEISVDGVVH
jgi:CRP-like cAMP-binding protein